MASIVLSRKVKANVVLEVLMGYSEFLGLQGHMDGIHLFAEKVSVHQTNISQRGKNEATKYFLIPRHLRKGFMHNNMAMCQRIDCDDKVLFVYVIDKTQLIQSKGEIARRRLETNSEQKFQGQLLRVEA